MATPSQHALLTWITELKALERPNEEPRLPGLPWSLGLSWVAKKSIDSQWIAQGAELIEKMGATPDASRVLSEWVDTGLVDPVEVEMLLRLHDLGIPRMGEDPDDEYNASYDELEFLWTRTVGQALVASQSPFSFGTDADRKGFLWPALSICFWKTQNGQSVFHGTRSAWLQNLCEKQPWARETVAQWCLTQNRVPPQWRWAFDDVLMNKPSFDFVRDALQTMDRPDVLHRNDTEHRWRQELLRVFSQGAPKLFRFLNDARDVYENLLGEESSVYTQENNYTFQEERAHAVHGMFAQHNASALTTHANIDGQLFGDQNERAGLS